MPTATEIVLVVGTNDIASKSTARIVDDIEALCDAIHTRNPSATIFVSEVLPRAQNLFPGSALRPEYVQHWNYEAGDVNRRLHTLASDVPWVEIIEQSDFHTLYGANRSLMSRDGLHLSMGGTQVFASNVILQNSN